MGSSRYFSALAALLFMAVCAYSAAALYTSAQPGRTVEATAMSVTESARLQGIVLRSELRLDGGWLASFSFEDGQRLSAGQRLGEDAFGRELLSPCSALFFSDADGLEQLSAEDIETSDLSRLRELLSQRAPRRSGARLVTENAWYYWAVLSEDLSLEKGQLCKLRFDGFQQEVSAWVQELCPQPNGEQTLLLRLNAGSSEYMKLRNTRSELIIASYSGLRLPESAVHTDSQGNNFVYTLIAGQSQATAVDIIYTGDGFFLAAPENGALALKEGQSVLTG